MTLPPSLSSSPLLSSLSSWGASGGLTVSVCKDIAAQAGLPFEKVVPGRGNTSLSILALPLSGKGVDSSCATSGEEHGAAAGKEASLLGADQIRWRCRVFSAIGHPIEGLQCTVHCRPESLALCVGLGDWVRRTSSISLFCLTFCFCCYFAILPGGPESESC